MGINTPGPRGVSQADYAESVGNLWRQYKTNIDTQRGRAVAMKSLEAIVKDCQLAIDDGFPTDYFVFHQTRAREVLKEHGCDVK